jgi:hypothetical protein
MFIISRKTELELAVRNAVNALVADSKASAEDFFTKYKTAAKLNQEIEELRISKARREEEFARREREIEHKVGLERKRQEFEIAQAKRETTVEVREENLNADKVRFKAEMDFQRKRLEEEVTSLRSLVEKMMERLPSADLLVSVSSDNSKRGR